MDKEYEFLKGFPELVRLLSSCIRNGNDFISSLKITKLLCSDFIGGEIDLILNDSNDGLLIEQVLINIYRRNPVPEVNYFVSNVVVVVQLGGNLCSFLDHFYIELKRDKKVEFTVIDLDEFIKKLEAPKHEQANIPTKLNLNDKKSISQFVIEHMDLRRRDNLFRDDIINDFSELLKDNLSVSMERQREKLLDDLYNDLIGAGVLTQYFEDESITEFFCSSNGTIELVKLESKEVISIELDHRMFLNIIERIVSPIGKRIDERNTFCEGLSANRKFFFQANLNPKYPQTGITLRVIKLMSSVPEIKSLFSSLNSNEITKGLKLVESSIKSKAPVILIGERNIVNRSLLSVFCNELHKDMRLTVVQEGEVTKTNHSNNMVFTTRPPSLEGEGETTIAQLTRRAIKFNPDYILIDEINSEVMKEVGLELCLGNIGIFTVLNIDSVNGAIAYFKASCPSLLNQTPLFIVIDVNLKISEIKQYSI